MKHTSPKTHVRIFLGLAFALFLIDPVLALAVEPGVTITSPGPLTQITVGQDGSFQVLTAAYPANGEVYPTSQAPGDAGFFLRHGGKIDGINLARGTSAAGGSASIGFKNLSQNLVGNQVTTVMDNSGDGSGVNFQVTQVTSYNTGENWFLVQNTVSNENATAQTVDMFAAADIYLADSDSGYGYLNTSCGMPAIGGSANPAQTYNIFVQAQSGSLAPTSYEEAFYGTIWSTIGSGGNFNNTLISGNVDNGAGLEWQGITIPAKGTVTVSYYWAFGNVDCVGYATNSCISGCLSIYNPNDLTVTTCSNSLPVNFSATASDSCCSSCVTLASDPPSGYNFPLGTTTVTTTATDTLGNSNSCTFTVTVLQNTSLPVIISCPTNIVICTISNNCGNMPGVAWEVQGTAAGGGAVSVTQNIVPGTLICSDTNVTFTVTDGCGNATQTNVPCSLIDCASNCLQLQCWTNVVVISCTNVPVYYFPWATDNCCSNWAVVCNPLSGSLFSPGTTTPVSCVATDSCGNSNSCTFTVTVLQSTNCTNCCPITLSPGTLPAGPAGVAYSQMITAASECTPLILYGTTALGDPLGTISTATDQGTAFSMTPNGVLTTLDSFTGANGERPFCLVQGSDGNFYGGTSLGGTYNDGTIFKMTPGGVLTTLLSLDGTDGEGVSGMVQGPDGNFYGTTWQGGSITEGTAFKMTPGGVLTTLVDFNIPNDGLSPGGGLVQGPDGNFYGTTAGGGSVNDGTVFKMTPAGVLTKLADFTGANGAGPYAALVQGSDGNFYGTTRNGGNYGGGTVFKITPAGVLTKLVDFAVLNGYPVASLIQGSDGNFYGTTAGSSSFGNNDQGSVFKMTPAGVLTTLVSFNGIDGQFPVAALVQASDGNFYGTTQNGGSFNGFSGTVFKMTPAGALTTLVNFTDLNGAFPDAALVPLNGTYTFAVTGGSLPPGLTLSPNGALSGTPTTPGVFCFTVTATDPNGCTGSTNYCLTNTCLALYCSNLVVSSCSCTNVSLADAVSYSDPCCSNTVSLQFFEGTNSISSTNTCFPVGAITPVTVVATDGCGNTAANVFDVTVQFGTPCSNACITIVCTNQVAYGCSNCVTVPLSARAIDTCCSNVYFQYFEGTTSISASENCFPMNTTNTVEVIATDDCGNMASSDITVTVLPDASCATNCLSVQCPTNIVVSTCSNCAAVNFAATATELCCSNQVTVNYSPPSGSCFPVGVSPVLVTATDDCSNFASCSFTVTVNQNTCLPVITVGPTNFVLCAGTNGCATMPDEVHGSSPIIYALYNTAVAANLMPGTLPAGSVSDPHWTLVSAPGLPPASPLEFGTNMELQVNSSPNWTGPDDLSGWIAPANDANNDGPEGNYDYQTTFILPQDGGVTISGQLAADDYVVEVLLNGVATGISITNGATGLSPFTLTGEGLAGTNTLDFIVHNNPFIGKNPPADNQDTPSGLLVEFSTVTTLAYSPYTPAAVQATNCDGTPASGWQSIPPGTRLCSSTNITFTFTNGCGDATSYVASVTVETCCTPPPLGMVLWLTFDETVGDTSLNSAGYNNGLRYEVNALATGANGPTHNPSQYVGNSLCFDGTGVKVVVPDYAAIDFAGNNFSMDAWVKWDGGNPTNQVLLDHRYVSRSNLVYGYHWFLANGKPGVQLAAGGNVNGPYNNFTAARALASNVWTHLAVTAQRGSTSGLKFYVNGAVSDTFSLAAVSGSLSNRPVDLWIGASPLAGNVPFNGCLDEIELFDRVLPLYQVYDIYAAGRAGKCRPTCSVRSISTICPGTTNLVVPVQVCNCGSSTTTFHVSFNGLTAAQAGGFPATNGPTVFSGYPATVALPPNTCTNFNVTITVPKDLTPAKVVYYQMTIQDGSGQRFSSIGKITDPITIYTVNCFPVVNPSTNQVMHLTWATNFVFVVNNPTNAVLPLNATVLVLDGNMLPETNLVSLNGLPPGTPATNQIVIPSLGSLPVSVNVSYLDSQPWNPFYLVLFLNLGDGGALIPVASVTFAQVIPPTVGPPLSTSTTNGQLVVSWDMVNTGWTLRSTPNLSSTNWVPVNLPVLPLPDGSQGVTLPPTNQAEFFQLLGPGLP